MRPWLLLAVVLLVPAAAAQGGPPPGQDDPAEYALDYAVSRAEDPESLAEDPGGEAGHAAWLACWGLDDAGAGDAPRPLCQAYYEPPQEAAPAQPPQEPAGAQGPPTKEAVALVDQVVGEAEGLVEDPGSAPGAVERIVQAAVDWVGRVVVWVEELVGDVAGGVGAAGASSAGIVGSAVDAAVETVDRVGQENRAAVGTAQLWVSDVVASVLGGLVEEPAPVDAEAPEPGGDLPVEDVVGRVERTVGRVVDA